MSLDRVDLLENASATGSAKAIKAGRYILMAEGTFGGATVTVTIESPNGTFVTLAGSSLTAAGTSSVLYIPSGNAKGVLTSGTPSAMYVYLVPA